jgi:hypothetical protein
MQHTVGDIQIGFDTFPGKDSQEYQQPENPDRMQDE